MTDTIDFAIDAVELGAAHPGEKLLSRSVHALATEDLLALVLGPGTAEQPAEALARTALERAGGLRGLAGRSSAELAPIVGLGEARAARVLAAFELGRRLLAQPLARGAQLKDGADVFRHYHASMRDLRVEQFRVLLLDGKHRVMREELISQGTLTSSPVHPREAFAPAIRHGAAAVVLVHNHPSGDPAPSADDVEITHRLAEAGRLLGIRVADHVVVGDGCFTSLAERGLLPR